MAPNRHSPETKAAVMAALLLGQSVSEVAQEYKVPDSTVSRWRTEAMGTVGAKKEIGDLLLEYVAKGIKTLTAQLETFGDSDYLQKQSASEVAVLHGVLADKIIRLLESLADSMDSEGENETSNAAS